MAARQCGAAAIVDPHPFAVASIADTYRKYPSTGDILPAMGYSDDQVKDLQATIDAAAAAVDAFVIGTPIDLRRLVNFPKPATRVTYDLEEAGQPDLATVLKPILESARS